MQTKLLGCLGSWLLLGSLTLAQTPATPAPTLAQPSLPTAPSASGPPAPPATAAPIHPPSSGSDSHPDSLAAPIETSDEHPVGSSFFTDLDGKHQEAPCFWVSGDFLLWWVRQGPLPVALLTSTNIPTGFPVQGQSGTQVLFGGGSSNALNFGTLPGGRLTLGGWVDPGRTLAFEGSGFVLQTKNLSYTAISPGDATSPVVGIPFNVTTPLGQLPIGESALASPFTPGFPITPVTFQVAASSRLFGGEVNAVYSLCQGDYGYWQLLVGYRNLDLQESLNMTTTLNDPTDGVVETVRDGFSTRNVFNGGQVGTRVGFAVWRFVIDGAFKLALGNTLETLGVTGSTNVTGNNVLGFPPPGTYAGGLFTQPSNLGSYHLSQFTAIPEFQLQVGYAVNNFISCSLGFNYLYVSDVLRPGNQINPNVDPTQSSLFTLGVPGSPSGPTAPLVPLKRSDFWATGLNFGVEFRF